MPTKAANSLELQLGSQRSSKPVYQATEAPIEAVADKTSEAIADLTQRGTSITEPNVTPGASKTIDLPITGRASTQSSPFGPWYFTSRYLHQRPAPLRPLVPGYPEDAITISGRVLLLLFIGESGNVDKYEIIESSPQGLFDDTAIAAFASEQYAPGKITGYAVRSQLLVEITYNPGLAPRATLTTPEGENRELEGNTD